MKLHFRPVGKARAAAAAQARGLDLGDHLVGRHAGAAVQPEDLAQRLVAAARLVVLQAPVAAVQAGVDLRADVAAVEAGLAAGGLELRQVDHACSACAFSVSTSSSSRSVLMKLSIWRSLTSITGASAQAPRHSLGCTVNTPSAVVP